MHLYSKILKKELVKAMGCTEPIAIAYASAKAKSYLDEDINDIFIKVSGNIIKNVKSVIVPHTGGLKGIEAAVVAGLVGGNPCQELEVLSSVSEKQIEDMHVFLKNHTVKVEPSSDPYLLDIDITLNHRVRVKIVGSHTNIVLISIDGKVIEEKECNEEKTSKLDYNELTVEKIVEYASNVDLSEVKSTLNQQIKCNKAIAIEGLKNDYGANIGKVLLSAYGSDVKIKARAYAAAGSDARMSGCEMPVVINSGSGNQGMSNSLPVIVYGEEALVDDDILYRSLLVSNLVTIHLKSGIGKLSAYCGAVSAGVGAGCGIAYMFEKDYKSVAHTLVNALAITSGIVCDGAKPSCAAKVASSVDAGILGYQMYKNGQEFKDGDGLVLKGVENTIQNFGRLGKIGMKETDKEIIKMMSHC